MSDKPTIKWPHPEVIEHFRNECEPVIVLLRKFFDWDRNPIVTARSQMGDFFSHIRDDAKFEKLWKEFASTVSVMITPTDTVVSVARRLKAL